MANSSVLCDWVTNLTLMQQSVLLSALRAPDGEAKGHRAKPLIRWYRRCVLKSAFDGGELSNPWHPGGGSFTGPSVEVPSNWPDERLEVLSSVVDDFLVSRDEMTLHYYAHFMHAAEIIGYKHDREHIRKCWKEIYIRMVLALHLRPESEQDMDKRLGDNEKNWRETEDCAGGCST